jgi:large subunit ribosomal protein L4
MIKGALRSALTAKVQDGGLKVIREFKFDDHKTKNVARALSGLKDARKVLIVDNDGENRNLQLGSRNIEGVTLVSSREINVYDLLGHHAVLMSEAAAKSLSEALAK